MNKVSKNECGIEALWLLVLMVNGGVRELDEIENIKGRNVEVFERFLKRNFTVFEEKF